MTITGETDGGRKTKRNRRVYMAPLWSDLANVPSPYLASINDETDRIDSMTWRVQRYHESTVAVSRQQYLLHRAQHGNTPTMQTCQVCADSIIKRSDPVEAVLPITTPLHPAMRTEPLEKRQVVEEEQTEGEVRSDLSSRSDEELAPRSVAATIVRAHPEPVDMTPAVPAPRHNTRIGGKGAFAPHRPVESSAQVDEEATIRNPITTKLHLGPARRVGLSKKDGHHQLHVRPPFLQVLAAKRQRRRAAEQMRLSPTAIRSLRHSPDASQRGEDASLASFGESIAPPPVYRFTLADLISTSNVLERSREFLASTRGDGTTGPPPTFTMLARIRCIGLLDTCFDRSRGARLGDRIDCCEIIVQDEIGTPLRVSLEGKYVKRWILEGEPGDQSSLAIQPDHTEQSDARNSRCDGTDVFGDLSFRSDSFTSRRTDEQPSTFWPLQTDDVVLFSNVRLRRSRSEAKSARGQEQGPASSVCAVVSDATDGSLEVCWRQRGVRLKTFDEALIHLDKRCEVIYRLATAP